MIIPLLFLANILALIPLLLIRLFSILPSKDKRPKFRRPGTAVRILIVLGSGGHTAEMFEMLRDLDPSKYTQRSYLVSTGDDFSETKAREFEQNLAEYAGMEDIEYGSFDIRVVPRARKIYQSALTAPWSCAKCLVACLSVLREGGAPDLMVVNGPATAVIVVIASLVLKFFALENPAKMRAIYVESWARVKHLSLSGKILLRLSDRFLVQWETLKESAGSRTEYRGVLV